jgi:hypothetical protein
MTLIHAVSGPLRHFPDFPAGGRVGVVRDVAARLFYFSVIATVCAFVLISTIGTHP